jgi:hypothetical protein
VIFKGQGWKTNATAASQEVTYRIDMVPTEAAANPSGYLRIQSSINGGAYGQVMEVYPTGIRIGNGASLGGGINLGGTPGSAPFSGNISTTNGLQFTTASTPLQQTFSFDATAGHAQTTGNTHLLQLTEGSVGFAPTSGNAVYGMLWLKPRVNQTGGASGISRGLFLENTLTAAADYRAIETDNNSGYSYYQGGTSAKNYFAGETNHGNATDQGAFTLQNTGGLYQNGLVNLRGTPTAAGTYTVLTHQSGSDSSVTQVDLSTLLTGLNVASGSYTATLTNGTNVGSSTFNSAYYTRVGNIVTVTMYITIDPTSTGATDIGISLPVASNLASGNDLIGHGTCTQVPAQTVTMGGDTSNDRANLVFVATDTNAQAFYFTFTYRII